MQEIQGNMDDVLSRNDLPDDEKPKRYFRLQNRYLAFKEQINTSTRPEEIISTVRDLTSRTQDSSTATTAFSTPLNPFNVTPELTQVSQKPDKESLTPPPPLNPAFLTAAPTVETPSQQGPKCKRRRIQFVNYLDDHKAHSRTKFSPRSFIGRILAAEILGSPRDPSEIRKSRRPKSCLESR